MFMGSKQAGLEACNKLIEQLPKGMLASVACPDDRNDSRSVIDKFHSLADANNIALHVVKNVSETVELIKNYNPTIVLVHGWYQIVPVAEFTKTLFLGFHYSPLPKYRGNAPLVWQIINGEKQLGVSFFQLSEGMDEGDLVDQKFFDLARNENISDALNKSNCLVQEMLTNFIKSLTTGNVELKKQAQISPSYCGIRLPEDGEIDWNKSAEEVHNFIRAQTKPYPGAFTYLPDGRKLTIWAAIEEQVTYYGVPGGVVSLNSDYVIVSCYSGAIKLLEVEIEGLQISKPSHILKSIKTRLG
jgi:methionyl-tRNA formyltransferase